MTTQPPPAPVAWQNPDCPRHVISEADRRDSMDQRAGSVARTIAAGCTRPLYASPTPAPQSVDALMDLVRDYTLSVVAECKPEVLDEEWTAIRAEAQRLAGQAVPALTVLQTIVGCVATYDRLRELHSMGHGTDHDATRRRFNEAMDSARAILAAPPVEAPAQPPLHDPDATDEWNASYKAGYEAAERSPVEGELPPATDSRSQRLRDAGFTRRQTWKALPPDEGPEGELPPLPASERGAFIAWWWSLNPAPYYPGIEERIAWNAWQARAAQQAPGDALELLRELHDCGAVTNWLRVPDDLLRRIHAALRALEGRTP